MQIGGNDILQKRDLKEVETELREVITALSDNTDNVVMISTGNVGGASAFTGTDEAVEYETLTRQFRAMVMKVRDQTPLTYVDLFLEPNVDIISLNPEKYLAIDGLHPSSEGYGLWYAILKPTLDEVLK